MLPVNDDFFEDEESTQNYELTPSVTYGMDWENKRILGKIDGREACVQFIRKCLSTDKYAFEIYDWYYGNELSKLVGYPYDYVITRIPNIIRQALLPDDRILEVRDFKFTRTTLDSVLASCYVDTVYGTIYYEQEILT